MFPHTIILVMVSTLTITSSGVALSATQDQVSSKRDMSSVWLAQAEAQAMVPLKRRNNVVQPAGTYMKPHRDCDDDEDDGDDDDDDDDDEDDEDDNDDKDEWDEGDNNGNGHHGGHHGNNNPHTDIGHGTNGRQGIMDGTHDESGTFTGTYTETMVPGATATNPAGQPEMTGRPSTASVVNTRSGAGLALVSLVLAAYFM
ncbi:hypothetical protein KI688_001619 [Linnemannia hyalina]|uniref:GPI anchored protein n=1 Tax=Linnemannia hyalina TaxID=64524 RepID=A0A9P7XTJ5_9FUNG|nr:hypothetical protein KI688_001619 [Linnemannia hyalina]